MRPGPLPSARAVRRYLVTPAVAGMESGRQAQEAVATHATVRGLMTTNVVVVRKDAPFTDMAAALRDCRSTRPRHPRGIWPLF